MSRALLDAADVARVIDRIAHQILEKTGGARDTAVLGIPTRGAPLARRLAARIRAFEGIDVPVGTLDITLHRDDLRLRGVRALEPTEEPPGGVDGRLVVLVDRGHRELPIRADYVGKNVPTSHAETVRVLLTETDGRDAVLLEEPAPAAGARRGAPGSASGRSASGGTT